MTRIKRMLALTLAAAALAPAGARASAPGCAYYEQRSRLDYPPSTPPSTVVAPPADHVVRTGLGNIADWASPEKRPPADAPYAFTKFYPSVLEVNRGDVVRWDFARGYNSWANVAFLGDMNVAEYAHANQDRIKERFNPDSKTTWGIWRPDDETVPGMVAYNEIWTYGIDPCAPDREVWENMAPFCGHGIGRTYNFVTRYRPAASEPCPLDGRPVASSVYETLLSMSHDNYFRVRVDLPPGTYRYHNLLKPGSEGYIRVVEDTPNNPAAAELDRATLADLEDARVLERALSIPRYNAAKEAWTVNVGSATYGETVPDGRPHPVVQLLLHLPQNLTVAPDEKIRWTADFTDPEDQEFVARFVAANPRVLDVKGSPDPNTVTFPDAHPLASGGFNCKPSGCDTQIPFGLAGVPGTADCETDEPNGGLPPVPGAWLPQKRCLPDTYLQVILSPWFDSAHPAPGETILPGAWHNSGQMYDRNLPGWFRDRPYDPQWVSEFAGTAPLPGKYSYVCLAHADFMRATVTVEPAG